MSTNTVATRGRQATPVNLPPVSPVPGTTRVSQGTAVEMSRAATEVLAAIQVAQAVPRSIVAARAEMQESCTQLGLAQRAFYSYKRGGETISGPTIYLAQELARVWRNVQYGMKQLSVSEEAGESEIEAYAWDVQTNSRNSTTVIVSHRQYTGATPKDLTSARDIYENNANVGARRMRSAIYRILPRWFTDEAEELCRRTLAQGKSGVRFDQRVENVIADFARASITERQLADKVGGRPRTEWTTDDVVDLEILFRTLSRREIRKEDAFPPERVTGAEIRAQAQAPAAQHATPPTVQAPTPPAATARPEGDYDPELGMTIPPGVGVDPSEYAQGPA
jgi:hypothetical protein